MKKKKKSSFLGHTHNHTQLYTQSGKEELESLIKNKGNVENNVRKNEKSGKTNKQPLRASNLCYTPESITTKPP